MRRWFLGFVCFGVLLLGLGSSTCAFAQLAPTPRKMPRTPVARHVLSGTGTHASSLPPSRVVEGPASIVDTERLRLHGLDIRLFGIVPPRLSASFGPQARRLLDTLAAAGPVACTVRDRDREGHFLATCLNASKLDFSLELLKHGLAATARGSLHPTALADPYIAAEEAAQSKRLGIWSVTVPAAVSEAALRQAAKASAAAKDEKDAKAQAAAAQAQKADPSSAPAEASSAPSPVPVTPLKADAKPESPPVPAQKPDPSASPVSGPTPDEVQAVLDTNKVALAKDNAMNDVSDPDFFERYQILLSACLMLLTALGLVAAAFFHRRLERTEERRAVAAALRGELSAARAVCLGRLQALANGLDDRTSAWPKIRILVFQATVGKIGLLGSELARKIASIYGLASDYAAYYATLSSEVRFDPVSTQQALDLLVAHIDDVLPSLTLIEKRRSLFSAKRLVPFGNRDPRSLRFPVSASPVSEPTARRSFAPSIRGFLKKAGDAGRAALAARQDRKTVSAAAAVPGVASSAPIPRQTSPAPQGSVALGQPVQQAAVQGAASSFARSFRDEGSQDPANKGRTQPGAPPQKNVMQAHASLQQGNGFRSVASRSVQNKREEGGAAVVQAVSPAASPVVIHDSSIASSDGELRPSSKASSKGRAERGPSSVSSRTFPQTQNEPLTKTGAVKDKKDDSPEDTPEQEPSSGEGHRVQEASPDFQEHRDNSEPERATLPVDDDEGFPGKEPEEAQSRREQPPVSEEALAEVSFGPVDAAEDELETKNFGSFEAASSVGPRQRAEAPLTHKDRTTSRGGNPVDAEAALAFLEPSAEIPPRFSSYAAPHASQVADGGSQTQQVAPGALWGMLRKFASEHLDRAQSQGDAYDPDYSNLTEAEMEALAYGLEPIDEALTPVQPPKKTGSRGGRR